MRKLACGTCGIILCPTAMFFSQGRSYWTVPPEDAARYDARCQAREHDLGPTMLGCRFMRRAVDPVVLPAGSEGPDDRMPDQPVTVRRVADLVAEGAGSAERHGITAAQPIAGDGAYTRRLPELFDWVNLANRAPVDIEAVFPLVQRYAPIHHLTLKDAVVVDQGAIITRGGALLHDSFAELLAQRQAPAGLTATPQGDHRWTGRVSRQIEAPTLLLKRPWWRNYGHWLLDAAALLALLRERRISGFEQIAIGAFAEPALRAVVRDTLSVIAPGLPVVEHPDDEAWQFSRLHYTQPVQIPDRFKLPDAVAALRRALLPPEPRPPGRRRLFVSRRQYRTRRLENEAEIVAVCARHGFEVVCPETLDLHAQVRLFAAASHVAGVKGAALTNLLFCPPATTVILLSPGDWADFFFWDLAGQLGFAYYELAGVLTRDDGALGQNPFLIDPARLDAVLRSAITEGGAARDAAARSSDG